MLDTSGALVPGATVRVTNEETGVAASAKTNDAGNFVVPYLLGGKYSIVCEHGGFKKWARNGVEVRIGDAVEVSIDLEVGSASETVQVSAETPLLATAEVSLGQVVDERRVQELPLFSGNAMELALLAPGASNGTNLRLRKAGFNNAPSQFNTDGSGNYQNEFTIDGVSNTFSDGTQPRVAFSPPATSISEFKVQTSAFDASLGHTTGASVNVSTKSGTNQLHGEMHEWLRHSALDAPTLFQNRSGQKPSIYQDNRYGVSGGGPVYIPRLYNGKNRTFWFIAWEANKFGNPDAGGNATSTVPTDKMSVGDLSEYLALGSAYQIYDPRSTTLVNGKYVRTPIPGNVIPQSKIDPVGLAMAALYPSPNQAGTKDFRNNFYRSGKALEDYWAYIGRFDHAFNENHRVFVRAHRDYWQEDKNRVFNNSVNGIVLNRNNKGLAFDDVYIFTPTFLVNFRYGVTYQDFPEKRVSAGYDLSRLGLSSQLLSLLPNAKTAPLPNIQITPYTAISSNESGDGTTTSLVHSFVGTFTKMMGNHTLRFGPEFRVYREARNRYANAITPQYIFNANYTKANDTAANPTNGGEIASLLMGVPAGSMTINDSYVEQDKYFAAYIQDDWKLTRKLTVNLGLRYEYESPITERFDRAAVHFEGTAINPLNDGARANYALSPVPELSAAQFQALGGLSYAATGNNGRDYWNAQKNNFNPRIGMAYQLTSKTILRAGYGIFTASIGTNYSNTIQTGFSQSTPMQASLDNGLTYIATLANPLPNGLMKPARSAGGLLTNVGQSVDFFARDRKHPYAQRWSVGVQRELPMKVVVETSYVGNRGTRLNVNRNLNFTPAQYLSTSPVRDQATIDYLGKTFPNPYYGLNSIYGKTMTRGNLLRAFSAFNDVTLNGDPAGYSWYHSMQTRVERRMANGWTVQGSYTWSKNMQATEFLNTSDPMPSEVVSDMDRTHRFTASGLWEMPFGHKRRFGANMNPVLDFAAGGWQLGGSWQHQSGAPLGFGNRIFNGDLHQIVLPKDERSVDHWFNVNAGFERNSSKQLASNIRTMPFRFNGIRGPNQDRWDFSLIKYFRINERWNTQFRAETYNALNHPNLSDPNTDPTSGSFGVISGQDSPRSFQLSLKVTF